VSELSIEQLQRCGFSPCDHDTLCALPLGAAARRTLDAARDAGLLGAFPNPPRVDPCPLLREYVHGLVAIGETALNLLCSGLSDAHLEDVKRNPYQLCGIPHGLDPDDIPRKADLRPQYVDAKLRCCVLSLHQRRKNTAITQRQLCDAARGVSLREVEPWLREACLQRTQLDRCFACGDQFADRHPSCLLHQHLPVPCMQWEDADGIPYVCGGYWSFVETRLASELKTLARRHI
jgi:hypothetical protein